MNPIKKIRDAMQMTQIEFAQACGLSAPTISNMERGANASIAWESAEKISAALKNPKIDIFDVYLAYRDWYKHNCGDNGE